MGSKKPKFEIITQPGIFEEGPEAVAEEEAAAPTEDPRGISAARREEIDRKRRSESFTLSRGGLKALEKKRGWGW